MTVKMADIARQVGVSRTTVSLVLNDESSKQHRIPDITIKRVRDVARDMGYRPNRMSQALRNKKSNMIGILVGANNSLPSAEMIAGITSCLGQKYSCVVANHYFDARKEKELLNNFIENRFEAVIAQWTGSFENIQIYREIATKHKMAMVMMETDVDNLDVPKVVSDHYRIAYEAVTALNEIGHKRIIFASLGSLHSNDKLNKLGYTDAMKQIGSSDLCKILHPEDTIDSWSKNKSKLSKYAAEIIKHWQQCRWYTAIISQGDELGYEIMAQAQYAGVSIPENISLIGFGNHIASSLDIVGLSTSCTQSLLVKGEFIAQIVSDILSGCKKKPVLHKMPVKVILRRTTKKID